MTFATLKGLIFSDFKMFIDVFVHVLTLNY